MTYHIASIHRLLLDEISERDRSTVALFTADFDESITENALTSLTIWAKHGITQY
jgi:hypothetical protein